MGKEELGVLRQWRHSARSDKDKDQGQNNKPTTFYVVSYRIKDGKDRPMGRSSDIVIVAFFR